MDLFTRTEQEANRKLAPVATLAYQPDQQKITVKYSNKFLVEIQINQASQTMEVTLDPVVAHRQRAKRTVYYIEQKHKKKLDVGRVIDRIQLIITNEIRFAQARERAETERRTTRQLVSSFSQDISPAVRQKIHVFNAPYGYGMTYCGLKNSKSIYAILQTLSDAGISPGENFSAKEKIEMLFEYYRTREFLFGFKIHRDLNPKTIELISKIIDRDFKEELVP